MCRRHTSYRARSSLLTCVFTCGSDDLSCYTTDLNRTQIYGASNGQYIGEENENAKNNLKSSVQTTQQSSNYLLNGDFEETSTSSIPYWTKSGTVTGGSGIVYADYSCATFTVNSSTTSSSIYQYVYLDNGDFWRTITDAIFGAISGGISAALEGKNVWAGI